MALSSFYFVEYIKNKMVNARIEMPNGELVSVEVTHTTTIEEILIKLNVPECEVFGERYDTYIGTPMSNKKLTLVDYNIWFPNDKSYIPSIVILDLATMTLKDRVKYDFYKSVGFFVY